MKKCRSRTKWRKVQKMKDGEIDYSDNPLLDEAFFREAVVWPGAKKQITLRIDPDVVDFFRQQGIWVPDDYQRGLSVLRKYMEAQKKRAS